MDKKKIIIISIIALVVIGLIAAFYGYAEFNRKNESVSALEPAFTLKVLDMVKAFETDEQASLHQYAGKVVQLEGAVKTVEKAEQGPVIVVLGDEKSSGSIRVEMDSVQQAGALLLQPGKIAILRAICTGYSADDLGLGADVLFNRGIVVKNN